MAYTLKVTNQFKKDVKRCEKRGLPMEKLKQVINILLEDGTLPAEYKPHKLYGDRVGQFECHIQPDWLLVWQIDNDELLLVLINTGTHSDLF